MRGHFICFHLCTTVMESLYNKTLLEQHGWKLPTSFTELEELAGKAKEAGVTLCMAQIQYPGSAFQYICNIAGCGIPLVPCLESSGRKITCQERQMSVTRKA